MRYKDSTRSSYKHMHLIRIRLANTFTSAPQINKVHKHIPADMEQNERVRTYKKVAPEGGWGYVILVGMVFCFVCAHLFKLSI